MKKLKRLLAAVGLGVGAIAIGGAVAPPTAEAQFCESLLGPMQRGLSDREIARLADLPLHVVRNCRRDLQRPIHVGPEGYPPVNSAGPPPRGAAGPVPRNPAGPPPGGAAGSVPRNPAGPAPGGAAGPPPVGRDIQRVR